MSIDTNTAPITPRAQILSGLLMGFLDGTPDTFGLFRVDDILQGIAGAIVEAETGATYTLAIEDAFKFKRFTEAGGCAITIPPDVFDDFTIITTMTNNKDSTLVAGAGVTIHMPGGGVAPFNYQEDNATVQLKNLGGNEWLAIGGIEGTI